MEALRKILFIPIIMALPIALTFGQAPKKTMHTGVLQFELVPIDNLMNDDFCSRGIEPQFPGGLDSLERFVLGTISYPKEAIKDSITGKVLLLFTVYYTGKVIDKKIKNSLRQDIDKECMAMLNKMPRWEPAKLDERTISVQLTLPLVFRLKEDNSKIKKNK
jgi:periplasmic protein TonB